MTTFKTEGIILKRANFAEADRILTVLTKHYGKIKIVVKGSRKITSKKASAIELFNLVELHLASGRNFEILTDVLVLKNFKGWKNNLKKIGIAYYFSEIIDKLLPENQDNPRVYSLLCDAFKELELNKLKTLILEFEKNILIELGYGLPNKNSNRSLKNYIEEITENKIYTPEIIVKLVK